MMYQKILPAYSSHQEERIKQKIYKLIFCKFKYKNYNKTTKYASFNWNSSFNI